MAAVTGVLLDNIENILKTQYIPRVPILFKTKSYWLSKLKRKKRKVVGNVFVFPAQTGESEGVGPGAYNADLPTPGAVTWIKPQFGPKPHRGRVRVYGLPIYETASTVGAYIRIWLAETQSMFRTMRRDVNNETLGDGRGELAYLPAADNDTSLTVKGNQGAFGAHLVRKGMLVDMIDASDDETVLLSGAEVESVTKTTVVVDSAPAGTDENDYLVRTGGLGYAFNGIDGIVHEDNPPLANYGGLDRTDAANDLWKAQVTDFTDDFSLELIDEFAGNVGEFSDGEISFILMRHRTMDAFGRELWEKVRYTNPTGNLDGKWRSLSYHGINFVSDAGIPKNTMFALDMSTFEMAEVRPLSWIDFDGHVIHQTANKEAFEASASYHAELICFNPGRNARADNVGTPG